MLGLPFASNCLHWFLADALGVAIMTPVVLAVRDGGLSRLLSPGLRAKTARLLACFLAVVILVFWQTRYPLLFLVPPVLAIVAPELGYAATTLSTPLLAAVALGGTLTGHGPFNLKIGFDTGQKMVLIQLFVLADVAETRRAALVGLAEANERLRLLSLTDPLTGLANRREFYEALVRETGRATAGLGALSLLMIDIDHFKRVNDTCGHGVGDDCIRKIGDLIQHADALIKPRPAPFDVVAVGSAVVATSSIILADVERRVGEDRIHGAVGDVRQQGQAVAGVQHAHVGSERRERRSVTQRFGQAGGRREAGFGPREQRRVVHLAYPRVGRCGHDKGFPEIARMARKHADDETALARCLRTAARSRQGGETAGAPSGASAIARRQARLWRDGRTAPVAACRAAMRKPGHWCDLPQAAMRRATTGRSGDDVRRRGGAQQVLRGGRTR
jgi:hypothetical protein